MLTVNNTESVPRNLAPTANQSSKFPEQFKTNVEPTQRELVEICHEHDVYLCDRLVEGLYGIQNLSLHIDKIKIILKMKE